MNRTDSRITSACSDAISLSTACAAVILPTSAIVVLLRQSLGSDRRFEAPGGRPSSGPASARCYTTSTDLTPPSGVPGNVCRVYVTRLAALAVEPSRRDNSARGGRLGGQGAVA